jgi:hypothetical protein
MHFSVVPDFVVNDIMEVDGYVFDTLLAPHPKIVCTELISNDERLAPEIIILSTVVKDPLYASDANFLCHSVELINLNTRIPIVVDGSQSLGFDLANGAIPHFRGGGLY